MDYDICIPCRWYYGGCVSWIRHCGPLKAAGSGDKLVGHVRVGSGEVQGIDTLELIVDKFFLFYFETCVSCLSSSFRQSWMKSVNLFQSVFSSFAICVRKQISIKTES